ncbi:serine protease [Nesidiocoris tenuis]|uniref:Serine protease n=1 Tax=Nesidiocoris tenuis TaxID=355587 RepID=A0ABN7AJR3_9HEMI|nr:serine protease [Nesidiocoris tenuis]
MPTLMPIPSLPLTIENLQLSRQETFMKRNMFIIFVYSIVSVFILCHHGFTLYAPNSIVDTTGAGLPNCFAMSSVNGVCRELDDCPIYNDVRGALKNGTDPPYYFSILHDFMACGFPNGSRTRICCDTEPVELPQSPKIPLPPHCGVQLNSAPRIVGGRSVVKPGTFPWLAEIMYKDKGTGSLEWQCAGALITERHVLTVAHCAYPEGQTMYKVRIGALVLNDTGDYWQESLVADVRVHPGFISNVKVNDIAVVVLATKVNFTRFVHPVCLPYQSRLKTETFERKHPSVAGWGRLSSGGRVAKKLKHVQLTIGSNDECRAILSPYHQVITPQHLCTKAGDGVHDSCRGDSGAPLVQPIGSFFYVIGLVSYGYFCAVKGFPSVNVRITEYIDWIAENIST